MQTTGPATGAVAGLTPMQERTLNGLIGTGSLPEFDPELRERLRSRLEDGLRAAGVRPGAEPLWLGKHRLNQAQRCQGLFDAGQIAGEVLEFFFIGRAYFSWSFSTCMHFRRWI